MKLETVRRFEPVWLLQFVLLLVLLSFFFIPQPALEPQTITILNPHSLPRVGADWTIYFNTTGAGELQVNDHSFPEEVDFVNLYRKSEQDWYGVPVIIDGDLITANWSYSLGKAVFRVKTPEEHTLEFRYGTQIAYAYNRAELYVSIGTPKSAARGQRVPVYGNAVNHNLSDVTLIYTIPEEFTVTDGETIKTCGDAYVCESNLTLDTTGVPTGTYVIRLDACTYGVCGTSTTEVRVDRLIVEPEEPQFDTIGVGEPVKWTQRIVLKNPFDEHVYNYAIPLPPDAFDSEPTVIAEVRPLQTLTVDVTFYTLPVEVAVKDEDLHLARMIPEDAYQIKVYDTEELIFSPQDYEMLTSLNMYFPAEKVQVRHNASLHYQDIPIAVPASTDRVSLFEDVNGTLQTVASTVRDNVVAWTVPQLSTRIYWVAPETYQGKMARGNRTFWTLEIEDIKTEYETDTDTPTTGLINKTKHLANKIEQEITALLPQKYKDIETHGPISYDPVTDTIKIVGDGHSCTASNPCTLTDIFEADNASGWNRVAKYYTYYVFDASVVIGDGESETSVVALSEYIDIRKPWTMKNRANFRMGEITDGVPGRGGWILSKVDKKYEAKEKSAFYVESGATLT
ncbi:MAG: hypothetical protein V3V63_05465, partial [Candidatus Hydrothermarchaeaceae archaeon]